MIVEGGHFRFSFQYSQRGIIRFEDQDQSKDNGNTYEKEGWYEGAQETEGARGVGGRGGGVRGRRGQEGEGLQRRVLRFRLGRF